MKCIRYSFLVVSISVLSSCYTTRGVYSEAKPYKYSEPELSHYSDSEIRLISKPDCNDPYLKIKPTAVENLAYETFTRQYEKRKFSEFYSSSLYTMFGVGMLSLITGGIMREYNDPGDSQYRLGGQIQAFAGINFVGLITSIAVGSKGRKKTIYIDDLVAKKYISERKYIPSTYFTVGIEGNEKQVFSDNDGVLNINLVDDPFNIEASRDYYNNPLKYRIDNSYVSARGRVKYTFDRQKIIRCINSNILNDLVSNEGIRLVIENEIINLLEEDDCYSFYEFSLAAAAIIAKELFMPKNKILDDLLELGGCYGWNLVKAYFIED